MFFVQHLFYLNSLSISLWSIWLMCHANIFCLSDKGRLIIYAWLFQLNGNHKKALFVSKPCSTKGTVYSPLIPFYMHNIYKRDYSGAARHCKQGKHRMERRLRRGVTAISNSKSLKKQAISSVD